MDTYYTINEKYLQAIDELSFGETPKALQLLNEIVNNDRLYARAHFQLGKIYYYDLQDYQTAGYHFKTCMELEPTFPGNYFHYLGLVVFLNMEKQVNLIAAKALTIPGVDTAGIHELMGLFEEKNKRWDRSIHAYNLALDEVFGKDQRSSIEDSIERVKTKKERSKTYQYHLTD